MSTRAGGGRKAGSPKANDLGGDQGAASAVVRRRGRKKGCQTIISWVRDGHVVISKDETEDSDDSEKDADPAIEGGSGSKKKPESSATGEGHEDLVNSIFSSVGKEGGSGAGINAKLSWFMLIDTAAQTDEDDFDYYDDDDNAASSRALVATKAGDDPARRQNASGGAQVKSRFRIRAPLDVQNLVSRFWELADQGKLQFIAMIQTKIIALASESPSIEDMLFQLRKPPDLFSQESVAMALHYAQRGINKICRQVVDEHLQNLPSGQTPESIVQRWFGSAQNTSTEPFSEKWNSKSAVAWLYRGEAGAINPNASQLLDIMEMRCFALIECIASNRDHLLTSMEHRPIDQQRSLCASKMIASAREYAEHIKALIEQEAALQSGSSEKLLKQKKQASAGYGGTLHHRAPLANMNVVDIGEKATSELLEYVHQKKERAQSASSATRQPSNEGGFQSPAKNNNNTVTTNSLEMDYDVTQTLYVPEHPCDSLSTLRGRKGGNYRINREEEISFQQEGASSTGMKTTLVSSTATLFPREASGSSSTNNNNNNNNNSVNGASQKQESSTTGQLSSSSITTTLQTVYIGSGASPPNEKYGKLKINVSSNVAKISTLKASAERRKKMIAKQQGESGKGNDAPTLKGGANKESVGGNSSYVPRSPPRDLLSEGLDFDTNILGDRPRSGLVRRASQRVGASFLATATAGGRPAKRPSSANPSFSLVDSFQQGGNR